MHPFFHPLPPALDLADVDVRKAFVDTDAAGARQQRPRIGGHLRGVTPWMVTSAARPYLSG